MSEWNRDGTRERNRRSERANKYIGETERNRDRAFPGLGNVTNECKKGHGEQGKWWNGKKKRGTDDERKEKERGKKKHMMKEKRHSKQRESWLQILNSCWYRDVCSTEASRFHPKQTDLSRFRKTVRKNNRMQFYFITKHRNLKIVIHFKIKLYFFIQ